MSNIGDLIEGIAARFDAAGLYYGHGTDNAWDEAVALVLGVTGAADERASLTLPVTAMEGERCRALATERIDTREPLAYLLGHCNYMGQHFLMRRGVIVPRSPIGYLLQQGLAPWLARPPRQVLDLCSGSGCLGIIAALSFPDAQVTLVEWDAAAVALSRDNVHYHALQDRVEVIQADVTQALHFPQRFDLLITNPPYVDAENMRGLPQEYRAEPRRALAAGPAGLSVIVPILARARQWLAEGGVVLGEVGASAPALAAHFPHLPFIWLDLPAGGEGVFVLEAAQLTSHTAPDFD